MNGDRHKTVFQLRVMRNISAMATEASTVLNGTIFPLSAQTDEIINSGKKYLLADNKPERNSTRLTAADPSTANSNVSNIIERYSRRVIGDCPYRGPKRGNVSALLQWQADADI